jgi:hypothetical protein
VFAVLPFELPVEARVVRRPVEEQHVVLRGDGAHPGRGVLPRPIESQRERSAVLFEVSVERVGDRRFVVPLGAGGCWCASGWRRQRSRGVIARRRV